MALKKPSDFFDKKSEHCSDIDTGQIDNLKLKEGLIAELENFKSTGDVNENLRLLKDIQLSYILSYCS